MQLQNAMPTQTDVPQFLRPAMVAQRLSISKVTLWRWVKAGRLPAPVTIGPGVKGWWAPNLAVHLKIHGPEAPSDA